MTLLHLQKKLKHPGLFWVVMTGEWSSTSPRFELEVDLRVSIPIVCAMELLPSSIMTRSRSTRRLRKLTHGRGGFVVWRAAQWYPDLVSHVFSVCTPYTAPHRVYFSTEDLVKGQLPQFAYQLHLASGEVEKSVKDEQSIRQFLRGMYGARGPKGELAFDPERGVLAENLSIIGESRILNGKVSSTFQSLNHERRSIYKRKERCQGDRSKTSKCGEWMAARCHHCLFRERHEGTKEISKAKRKHRRMPQA
jgi:hypothetical protein